MKQTVYKKGDKVIAVKNCEPWLTKGKEYIIAGENINDFDCIRIEESDDGQKNLSFFKVRFSLVPSEMPLGEQVELAQTYIGKNTTEGKCKSVQVCLTEKDVNERSFSCQNYFKEHGFCVAIMGGYWSVPLPTVSLAPESKTIKLTDDYNAEVFADKVKVGCQTIPLSKLEEILTIAKTL